MQETFLKTDHFLYGGGEMGELIRSFDWEKTEVGGISEWPQSLRTTLSIILHSKFPMFLFWGPGLICFYNDAYRPSLGNNGKHPSALGSPAEEVWPEIWHIIKPLIDQVLAGGEATWSEDQLIPIYRNGKLEDVYWTFSYSPVNDESGAPAGVFVVCTETTEKVNIEKNIQEKIQWHSLELEQIIRELKKSEERYHLMISEVQDYAILYLNADGTIENWNKGAEKIKGYKAEEIIGKNFSTFYTEEDRKSNLPQRLLNEAMKNERAVHEGWRVRKDGTLFWGSIVLTALHDEKGNIIGFSKVTRNLTEKKESDDKIKENAEKLEQKNSELEKINKELESFAYVASHDLQEPLRKIQTFTSHIMEKDFANLSEKGKNYFERIKKSAGRMQLLIDDLLRFSRTSTEEKKYEQVDLSLIIENVRKELQDEIPTRNVEIEYDELPSLRVIPFQFHQLFMNLISNSIKFSKTNIESHIIIRAKIISGKEISILNANEDKMYHHITVSDNGIGFSPEYGERIFEVFQRLHGRHEYEGTGIGLAICRKIAENHHGFINATGTPAEGAIFNIYVPVDIC